MFCFQSESPSATQLNDLDKYLLFSLLFVVGALVEFAIVVVLSRRKRFQRKDVENQFKSMIKMIGVFDGHLRRRIKRENRISNIYTHKASDTRPYKEDNDYKGKESNLLSNTNVHMIDFTAFILFNFMYILFNFVYWHRFWMNHSKINALLVL